MKVLLSIKPEYAEKILDGQKLFEFRKAIPKATGVKTAVIYATMPVGKVIGEFDIDEFMSDTPNDLWSATSEFSGITKKFFNEYFRGRKTAYAIKIGVARRYKKPLDIKTILGREMPPQSFCYL
ncbi:ASCH domain-containing protein [Oxalobacter vibrioformis]|uniref:ASCH domain-containing protein n=1 Tax=Oxalobacter vibrioformis TaxID=933080 RepID=A0A9E9P3L3_9BURK|nr:ASCH domain-containing protein [Oxalobacter vibrioformis]WAW11114.1 ASCH domain-containing protein [Oxalobacter vibrioformis]